MKKVLFPLSIALIAALFVACDDDEDPAFDLPTIQVVTGSLEQRAGESIDVNASVVADAGIKRIMASVNGEETQDVTGSLVNEKAGIVTYSFQVPGDAEEGTTFEVSFTITDQQ